MATDRTDTTRTNEPDRNPDPITGAPGSHPAGVGIGGASGGATGAAIGMIGGPIGAVIGAIAGTVVGGYVGKGIGEKVDPTEDDTYWREQHKSRPYYKETHDYDNDLAPAYRYGSTIGLHADSDHDRPATTGSTTGSTTSGIGDTLRNAKDKVKDALTPDSTASSTTTTNTTGTPGARFGYDTHEHDIRAGWDKVRGKSGLSYEQARDAIRDAYDRRLQLREEQLRVGKERVQTGEASIRKEVITEHRSVDVPLQREELVIERRPASGQAAAGTIGQSETIRVPLSEERATVSKNTVVTEEVSIGKKSTTDTQRVGADVSKEKLVVDDATRTNKLNP